MPIGNIYVIAATAVVGGGLFGFDIASVSAQLTEPAYLCYFNQGPDGPPFNDKKICSGPTSLHQGGITAAMPAGSWLGALVSGPVSDRIGRKWSIIIGCIVWMIGSTLTCAAQNIGMLVVGRIINGLAVGFESAQVPVYISEISPPTQRGRFVGLQQWAITWGIMIMYYISFGCSYIGGQDPDNYSTASWRIPWGLQMLPAVFLGFAMTFLPESPRWLARQDRWEECHGVLTLVHGKGDPNHPFVQVELQDIKEMCEFERRHANVTYLDLFKPHMLNRTLVAYWYELYDVLHGYIFTMAGYNGNAALLASSIQYIINVIMTLPALVFIDRVGRRNLMLLGSTLMMTFMFANAGIMGAHGVIIPGGINGVKAESMRVSGAAAKGLIACTYLFVASYAPTWGPASWIYPPELFPLRLRGKGVALSTSGNWAFNTALGLFTPVAFANIRYRTYIIFGVFNLAMTIHVFFGFPETAGKTLEETEAMFEDPNGIPYIGTAPWKTGVSFKRMAAIESGALDVKSTLAGTNLHVEEAHTAPVTEEKAVESTAAAV
ncbi:sugar transporter, putative [Talaromyces stipitatus ATCC 10500]|uniref:Sugar transporter, putative n=1 Tax=Talaromyces stipitatus (strain ATCC 10500 / CBS 375.48 / QM 6759 / NRRL 1006) TaxID=441959 RepID=B8M5E2_TALSN|nr:sugar transporter, putative [Talaromyces stipitatus ATCC 10500]EED19748.1 sugar transporter, putative [Talaromyces stipitatus ATCC 10500]